jgi:hypothetical protein
VSEAFPLVNYLQLGWSSRFDTFWLLPGLLRQSPPPTQIERFLREAVLEDLTRRPPDVVWVDVAPRKAYFADAFDYIDYFSADPRFTALWTQYRPLTRIGHFQLYRRAVAGGS